MKFYRFTNTTNVWTLFMLCFVFLVNTNCNSDRVPNPSKLNDTRPRIVLSLSGFNPGSKTYIRFWEGNNAFTYPSNYALYIDASGRLLGEIVLSQNTTSADVLIYVDQSGNGILDVGDFGTYQSIRVNTSDIYTNFNVPYQAATLTAFSSATPLPSAGQQKICIYMPTAKPAWSSALISSMPQYPFDLKDSTLVLSDWFPVSIVTSGGITQTFPKIAALGANAYNETCVLDANLNGKYDTGETLSTTPVP
ncbi:MAG: hypothetical protein OEV78_05230 [Spirochaetia bacterium]|nr:hypothetical protein [Spirochaetia bacterium]